MNWGLFPAVLSVKSQYTRTTALSQKNIHRKKGRNICKKTKFRFINYVKDFVKRTSGKSKKKDVMDGPPKRVRERRFPL